MSFVFYILMTVLSFLFIWAMHVPKEQRRLYLFMTIFGNVGFMGFPVVSAVYGNEGLFYAAILNCMFNIIIYTFGVVLMTAGDAGGKKILQSMKWKKLLLSPAVLCSIVAVIIFSCHIKLPSIIADTLDTLGGLTSPLAMLVVGANLSGMKIKEMLGNVKLDIYVLVRQFILPLIFWLVIRLICGHAVLAPVWLLLSAMPVANTTALFATEYGGDEKLASESIFLTTLLSLVPFHARCCSAVSPAISFPARDRERRFDAREGLIAGLYACSGDASRVDGIQKNIHPTDHLRYLRAEAHRFPAFCLRLRLFSAVCG